MQLHMIVAHSLRLMLLMMMLIDVQWLVACVSRSPITAP